MPGRPRVNYIMPLTNNGSAISIREYKNLHDTGLKVIQEFVEAAMKRPDGLELCGDELLNSTQNTSFADFVESVIRAHIPPKLRGFFTNPQAKEEYVKITRDGMTGKYYFLDIINEYRKHCSRVTYLKR